MNFTSDYSGDHHYNVKTVLEDVVINNISDRGFVYPQVMSPWPHTHMEYEIHIPISSTYEIVTQTGSRFVMTPGKILIIPPGIYHNSQEITTYQKQKQIIKMSFRFTILKSSKKNVSILYDKLCSALPSFATGPIMLDSPMDPSFFYSLWDEFYETLLFSKSMIENCFQRFWICFFRLLLSEEKTSSIVQKEDAILKYNDTQSGRRDKIDYFLDEKRFSPIKKNEIAEQLKISPRQLSRFFKREFGKTFSEFLAEKRIRTAIRLMETTNTSIDCISEMVGYSSLSAFYTAFKKKTGMTPKEYKTGWIRNNKERG